MKTNTKIKVVFKTCLTLLEYILQRELVCLYLYLIWYIIFKNFYYLVVPHPTPVLLPGKSHGQRSLVGCSPWGREVGHDWATSLSLFTFMHWRRKWQPAPVLLPGESQGRGGLMGCRLWGHDWSNLAAVLFFYYCCFIDSILAKIYPHIWISLLTGFHSLHFIQFLI